MPVFQQGIWGPRENETPGHFMKSHPLNTFIMFVFQQLKLGVPERISGKYEIPEITWKCTIQIAL